MDVVRHISLVVMEPEPRMAGKTLAGRLSAWADAAHRHLGAPGWMVPC